MCRKSFLLLLLQLVVVTNEVIAVQTTTDRPSQSDAWKPMFVFFLTEDDTKPDVLRGINEFFDRYVTCNLSR